MYGAGGVFGAGGLGVLTGNAAAYASAAAAGFAAGGIQGGNLNSALNGAFTAMAFYGVGNLLDTHGLKGGDFLSGKHVAGIVGHAIVGCASSAAGGGSCGAGAAGSAFSMFMTPGLSSLDGTPAGLAAHALAGAAGSALSGGDPMDGALRGAMGYLFNQRAFRKAALTPYTESQLTNIIFTETESLSGDTVHEARVAVGFVAMNRLEAGIAGGIGNLNAGADPWDLKKAAVSALQKQIPSTVAAYNDSAAAAQEVLGGKTIDPTGGALFFRMGTRNQSPGKGYTLFGVIGPLNNSAPSGQVPRNAYIRFYGESSSPQPNR
jgi:hypothetical protein